MNQLLQSAWCVCVCVCLVQATRDEIVEKENKDKIVIFAQVIIFNLASTLMSTFVFSIFTRQFLDCGNVAEDDSGDDHRRGDDDHGRGDNHSRDGGDDDDHRGNDADADAARFPGKLKSPQVFPSISSPHSIPSTLISVK